MEKALFINLKPGDKVVLMVEKEGYPESGTILHRRPNWLDDNVFNCFEYDENGVSDYSFFSYDDVEMINENE